MPSCNGWGTSQQIGQGSMVRGTGSLAQHSWHLPQRQVLHGSLQQGGDATCLVVSLARETARTDPGACPDALGYTNPNRPAEPMQRPRSPSRALVKRSGRLAWHCESNSFSTPLLCLRRPRRTCDRVARFVHITRRTLHRSNTHPTPLASHALYCFGFPPVRHQIVFFTQQPPGHPHTKPWWTATTGVFVSGVGCMRRRCVARVSRRKCRSTFATEW